MPTTKVRLRRRHTWPALLLCLVALFVVLFVVLFVAPTRAHAASFSFTLEQAGRTSAGVFSREGRLVRTLWSGVTFAAGVHAGDWDGADDAGVRAPNGRYEVRVLSARTTYTWEGVVGNTSSASSGPTIFHFLQTIGGMAVAGRTAFVAAGYNEGLTSQARFSTADIGNKTSILAKGAQFRHVATDGERVYWAGNDPNIESDGFVVATGVKDDAEIAFDARFARPFATRYGMKYASAIDVLEGGNFAPSGIAVQRRRPYLFVAHRGVNSIHVLDRHTGRVAQRVPCEAPGDLAVDANDDLWVVHTTSGARVVQRMTVRDDGALVPGATLAGLVRPVAVAAAALVLVADGGASQQVRAFDLAGKPLWTLGQAGGYARDPKVTDDKFDFEPGLDSTSPAFLALQPDGAFWVGDPGCARILRFAADRSFVDRVAYVPISYSAAADPNDPSRVFADYLEYAVDYALPLGPGNGSWRLVRNWRPGVPAGLDNKYARMKSVTTLRNQRTYAVLKSAVFELPDAGPLRRTGVALPGQGRGSTLFRDGSVRSVDERDGHEIWLEQRLTGFDAANNPRWGPPAVIARAPLDAAAPHDIGDTNVLDAGPRTSSGVIVAYDFTAPAGDAAAHTGWHLGGVQEGTDRWLWWASRSTPRNYLGPWPDDGSFYAMRGINAGGAVLTSERNIFYEYRGEGFFGGETNKWRHYFDDGLYVGEFGVVGRYLSEAAPEMAGNAFNGSLVRLRDGRTFIYHNDESWHGGVHRWRIDGLDSIHEQTVAIELGSAALAARRARGSRTVDLDLLAGLPADASVKSGTGGWTFEPAADAEWSVLTNFMTWQRDPPVDLDVSFSKTKVGATASLSRELPVGGAPLRRWRVDARIAFAGNYINHGATAGQYLDVLDARDKIIARLYPVLLVFPDDARLYGNRAPIVRMDDYVVLTSAMGSWQPLRISAEQGRIAFSYGAYPTVTTEVFDAGADWAHPRRLRLSFWNGGASYRRACQLDDLTFHGEP